MAKLNIRKPDDSGQYLSVDFNVLNADGTNKFQEGYVLNSQSGHYHRNSNDPVTEGIVNILPGILGIPRRGYYQSETWSKTIVFDGGFAILIEKQKTRYRVLGKMVNKAVMFRALAKTFYRATQDKDVGILFTTLQRNLNVPDNVAYALENRAPYYWFSDNQRHKVSLRVELISEKDCAIEISDGVWADIKTTDLNSFLNFYRYDKKNSSWKNLSPARLWLKLMKSEPTEGQLALMKAFLLQNRTQDLVERRAQELMLDLEKQYPDRIKIKKEGTGTWMYVRGKIADWALSDKGMKTGIQMVGTYVFSNEKTGNIAFQHGEIRGPICIDNMTSNSTLGDQFATRAIALMNDTITIQRVNTIRRYIPEAEGFEIEQTQHRMNWNDL
jgi:hypothetical protein